ncbi:MAG: hypothetical protein QXY10_02900 [Candidatus Micrarchaeaceae archaeon]
MEETPTYDYFVDLINKIVSNNQDQKSVNISYFLDIKSENDNTTPNLTDLIALIEETEHKRSTKEEKNIFNKPTWVITPNPVVTKQQPKYEPHLFGGTMEAKKELKEITQKIEMKKHFFNFRNTKLEDLVLPNLSITDQISELERIIEGLKENVFDNEHLEIIKEEIYGLADEINRNMKKMKKEKVAVSEYDQAALELRNQRLNDAITLIEKR